MEYESIFNKSDVVICWNRGIYKFLKAPDRRCMKTKYLPYKDVIMFLKMDLKVMLCDYQENVIECNF